MPFKIGSVTNSISVPDNNWRSIAWDPGLGLFAAVADSGIGTRVMTSVDAVSWIVRPSAADNAWRAIASAPDLSLLTAVAASGVGDRAMSSSDGDNWTIRASAADNNWNAIAWSPALGLFAAVADSGVGNRVMTSPNGITWTIQTSAADNNWNAIAWSPALGLFAAVAGSGVGNRVMTSPDGITWTIRSSAADNNWSAIAWSPALLLFVAVAESGVGNRVMTSPDGVTWTIRSSAADNDWQAIAWSPELGKFAAVANTGAGDRVMTSADGVTWAVQVQQLAHYNMLQVIRDFLVTDPGLIAAGQNWTQLRYITNAVDRELILQGPGLSGTEQIFIGIKSHQSEPGDFYNLRFGTMTGYIPGNTFGTQPGFRQSSVPAHNLAIDYWMIGNGQRLAAAFKVGTPVYMSGYIGKMLPYARPSQFPSPLINAGMLIGAPETRFSDPGIVMPYKGARSNFALRSKANQWIFPECHPWTNTRAITGAASSNTNRNLRDTGGFYHPVRIEPHDAGTNVYGFLDGLFYITGFNNQVENVLQVGGASTIDQTGMTVAQAVDAIRAVGGRAFVVIQDGSKTGPNDYYVMEMD